MRFKEYYYSNRDNKQDIFESVFEKYYTKGYFGKITKKLIKEQQQSWYNTFLTILDEGNTGRLLSALASRENICTREWFSRIYGVDIVDKSKDDISAIASRIFNMEKTNEV